METPGSDDEGLALIPFTKSGETGQSAGSMSDQKYDFLDFLGVAQSLKIDFLPITWQPALDSVGEGGTAKIRQALINLQMTFAFKHFKHPRSVEEESRNWRALIAEISVLGNPIIRSHPNVVTIEGICWDVVHGGEKVWPVLVFQKTRYWDLNRLMRTARGKELVFRSRLDILFDVALAVRDLHATGVIHGDIKPENVLIFSENDGRHVAKVTDFGYSTLFTTDSDLIVIPSYSKPWQAPEWHHRGILPTQARKMDAYSFGMLCIWLLFYNKAGDRDQKFKKDLEDPQRDSSHHAFELLEVSADLENWEKCNMQKLFRSTLAQDPIDRAESFTDLLELLSPNRAFYLETPADNVSIPHCDFQITPSIHQLTDAHYGVRCYIAKCLMERQNRDCTSRYHTLNLAFCYELGLGISRDSVGCRSLLSKYNIPVKDLEDIIEQLKRNPEPSVFQKGKFRTFLVNGHITLSDLSQQYRTEQLSREAESQYRREVKSMRSILGDAHYLVQQIRSQLSNLMVSEGRFKDAEELHDRMIEFDGGRKDNDHLIDRFASDLAMIYSYQGRWKDAEDMYQQLMDREKKYFGSDHPYTLISMGNLARTYKEQKRWNEAEQLETHIIKIYKKVFGTEHQSTLTIMNNMATTYSENKQWTQAAELQMQVMETSKRVLGAEHLDTLKCMSNLASTYEKQNLWEEAEELQVQIVEKSKSLLGTDHPETLRNMNNLAMTYSKLNRWKEAEDLFLPVVKTGKKVLGMEHPDILKSMGSLIRIYRGQRRWEEVEEWQVQVVDVRKRVFGIDHPDTLIAAGNLAAIYEKLKRWKEAASWFMEVMETRKKKLGADNPDTLMSMNDLARILWHQGQDEDTEELESEGQWKMAEELEEHVMETRKRTLGAEHLDTLISMNNVAMLYRDQVPCKGLEGLEKQELLKKAENLQVQVVETRKTVLGTVHIDTLTAIIDLISIYEGQERRQDVEDLMSQVTVIEEGLKQLLAEGRGPEGGMN